MEKFRVALLLLVVVTLSAHLVQGETASSPYIAKSNKGTTCPASCLQSKSFGHSCGSSVVSGERKWYFNKDTEKCETFQHEGCGGNGNRFDSKKACKEKCGDCGSEYPRTEDDAQPQCDCHYKRSGIFLGGCKITVAPPQGYKCKCYKTWIWSCGGSAIQCGKNDKCPADCDTKECCDHGGGNCKGYENKVPKFGKFQKCLLSRGIPFKQLVDPQSQPKLYAVRNHQWNFRLPKVTPLAYFIPKTTKDVQAAVKCGRKHKVPLTPKSGGHSYEGYCYGNADSVVIDFRDMDEVTLLGDTGTARIGPGARLGGVLKILQRSGYGLPMGQCTTVGVGGQAVGGGTGFFAPKYGLMSDNILEATVVDADGNVAIANTTQNPDLFWAVRGMGSGYIGLETKNVLVAWQNWIIWANENEPTTASSIFIQGYHPGPLNPFTGGIDLQLTLLIEPNENKSDALFLKMAQQIFPKNGNISIEYPDFMGYVLNTAYTPIVNFTNQTDWTNLKNEVDLPRYLKQKSLFINGTFTESQFEKLGKVISQVPPTYSSIFFASEGGVVSDLDPRATAYVHRRAKYSIEINYEGSPLPHDVQEGLKWQNDVWKASQFMDAGETYQNYVDTAELKDWMTRYYGENLKELINVKRKWDPKNYFQDPSSIPIKSTHHFWE